MRIRAHVKVHTKGGNARFSVAHRNYTSRANRTLKRSRIAQIFAMNDPEIDKMQYIKDKIDLAK